MAHLDLRDNIITHPDGTFHSATVAPGSRWCEQCQASYQPIDINVELVSQLQPVIARLLGFGPVEPTCMYCGCTDINACVLSGGHTCSWWDWGKTICSNPDCVRKAIASSTTPVAEASAEPPCTIVVTYSLDRRRCRLCWEGEPHTADQHLGALVAYQRAIEARITKALNKEGKKR